ncbi:MAG: asparagine synthase (glutamine-hydrolyzing) [Acidobacteria bacterium RIFCSPLOWO2_12_FULL_54_10]|nr:MAG: asparagine synthase (glutamine-hydrolyzing) [Acidobacteria bacterium RIFCSPLOWO2_12_FULL_54_10]OFW17508.1 MAG: asparagine synthase (glutamine-hydrolyzing) [Acidobacteria bacterium RIFCSPLOWO2_02_FULL_59_13]
MCGIVGIVSLENKPVFLEELRWMSAAIAHRGPDEDGFYLGTDAGIGMRRLSIIDLKSGRQPIANEDGTIHVVFNGEIYNYRQLRKQLEQKGHCFSTTTDTETIVHLYEEYGDCCVQEMRGMFAFAIWDERRHKLLLARDRLGIKPLYYTEVNGRLLFASELKAILQLPDVERKLNWNALNHLFTFLSTPAAESILEGIRKLQPGHILIASPGRPPRVQRYWDLHFEPDRSLTEEDCTERLRELLDESVGLHLASDVPVGAFLSGGIDSSAVVAAMSRMSSDRVKTFSIGFNEEDYDELQFARLVAKQFGTEHYELVLESNVLEMLSDLAWHLDEPFGDASAIPTYMVSKLASQYVKVVLSGDGGDELFAGYDKYAVEARERNYKFLPSVVRRVLGGVGNFLPDGIRGRNFLRHMSLTGAERYLDASTLFRRDDKRKLFQGVAFENLSSYDPSQAQVEYLTHDHGDWLSALQSLDLKSYLPLDILTKVDRMSMAHSLEVRVPLLDHKLVEFVATIPPEMKMRNGTRKYVFKRAMTGLLPTEIIHRPKQGFAIPLGRWFRGKLDNVVRELLLSEEARRRGLFRPTYIERLLELQKRGRDLDLQLWTLISFEMWCKTFLDGRVGKVSEPRAESNVSHSVLQQSTGVSRTLVTGESA